MVSLSDQVAVSVTNFLTGVIIARACTKEEFGLYMLGFSVVVFATELQTSLILTPYMVYSPRLTGSMHARYTGSTLVHQLMLSIAVAFALTAGAAVLSHGIGPEGLAPIFWTLVVVITFILLRDYIRKICFAGLRMRSVFFFDFSVAIVQLSSLFLLAYYGLLSASRTYWVVGVACGITSFGWLILNRKTFTLDVHQAISDFGQNWSFGKWIFASGLLWALSMNLYPWFLTAFHGTASAGVWAACFGIAALGNPLLFGVQNFLGPKIVHAYTKGGAMILRRFVLKASVIFSLILAPVCVILLIFGGKLIVLLYSEKYTGNGLVVSVLALNLLIHAASFTLSRALFVIGRPALYLIANCVPLFVLLTFGIILVKFFGPLGVACGLLASTTATSAVMLLFFSRLIKAA